MKTLITLLTLIFMTSLQAQSDSESKLRNWRHSQNETQQSIINNYFNRDQADTDTNISQIGNYNTARIDAQKIKLEQNGQDQFFYHNQTSILPSDLKVDVEGINSSVEIFGNNEIINNAKIKVKGNDRSVIIRNYQ